VAAPGAAIPGAVIVNSVFVEGATAFPAEQLRAAAGALSGTVPLTRIEAARAAILARYREAGFVFTAVDAIAERDGTLRLVVTEAEIVDVRLDGDIGPAGAQVLRFLRTVLGQRPVDIATLERALLLAQDVPGVSVRTLLRPAGTAPGALDLVALVTRQPISGYATADNRGYRLTGPEQGIASIQFDSFTALGERTELTVFGASGRTQLFGQLSNAFFVGASGLRVRLYAGRGEARPSGALRALGYEGETTVAGGAVLYPLIRQRSRTLMLSAAFDAIDSRIDVDDVNGAARRLSRDQLRVVRLAADWSSFDVLLGAARPATNVASIRLSQGIAGLGATRRGSAELSRAGAEVDFSALSFLLSRTQAVFSPWQDATVAVQLTLGGQWSNDVLPASEKFYLGGTRLGRGFFAGEVTGDRALAGGIELQLQQRWEAAVFGTSVRVDPTFYAFYDLGETWENQDEDPNRRIASAGIGVRFSLTEHAEFQLEGVRRFTRRPAGAGTDRLERDALFWRVLARF
jgi:hemolysin activation/secretion protein